MTSKDGITLGDLRNISLSYVPNNEIWTTWDDDDWRSSNYLSILCKMMTNNGAKFIIISASISRNPHKSAASNNSEMH